MVKAIERFYNRFVRIRGNPREVALGFALGIFIGFSPTMGVQIALAVFFASILKWNKYSAALAVWITNPLTAPFIYSLTYLVGAKLLGIKNSFTLIEEMSWSRLISILQNSPGIITSMLIGGIIIGLPLAALGYIIAYNAVESYQKKLKEKLRRQKEKIKLKVAQKKLHADRPRKRKKMSAHKSSNSSLKEDGGQLIAKSKS